MKFLALIKIHSDTASKTAFWKFYEDKLGKDGKWTLPEGVKLLDGFQLWSKYDVGLVYEAPDEEVGMEFLSEIWNYADIEKFITTKCPWCDNIEKS